MAKGRYFSEDHATDATNGVIINEALAHSLGWDDPVGKRLDVPGDVDNGTVIGMIEDFHLKSLHHAIDPVVLFISPRRISILSVRITGENIPGTIAFLREKWMAFEPKYPFEYYFLDQTFAQLYQSEQRLSQTLGVFSILALLIACLGLFGLASFTAEQRIKEIVIRKVLGASVSNIILLLSKDFVKLILILFQTE